MPRERRPIPWLKIRDGVYYVYWYDDTANRTKRISLNTRESVEAQARYAAFLSGGHEIFGSGRGSQIGVATALDQYLREHAAEKLVERRRTEVMAELLKQWFKNTPLQDVDIPACRAYGAARKDGTLLTPKKGRGGVAVQDGTIRKELGVLSAAAGHAARWKRIGPKASPPTPMPSIELPAVSQPRDVYLTKPELALAIDKATGRLKDFIQVVYYTAARRRSVERLTRGQVDLRQSRINLTSPHENANELRSKKRRPVVPLDPKIRPIVERLLIECDKTGSDWLWGDCNDMYRAFNDHMCAIGLAAKSFPHVLRHSRATHLLQDGKSLYVVARLLGDTIATVDRVYGHHSTEHLAGALEDEEKLA